MGRKLSDYTKEVKMDSSLLQKLIGIVYLLYLLVPHSASILVFPEVYSTKGMIIWLLRFSGAVFCFIKPKVAILLLSSSLGLSMVLISSITSKSYYIYYHLTINNILELLFVISILLISFTKRAKIISNYIEKK